MADHVEINYDEMADIAQSFDQQGEEAGQMLRAILSQVDNLRAGGWAGQGANAFFAEMDDLILPALNRLVSALQQAADVARATAYQFGEAEQEAAHLFSGEGVAGGDHVGNFNFKVEIEGVNAAKVGGGSFKMGDGSVIPKVEGNVIPKIESDVIPKVAGNPAADAAHKVYGGPDSHAGDQAIKWGSAEAGGDQVFKFEGAASGGPTGGSMFGGPGGGPVTDISKIPNPPAPDVNANKFVPGGSAGGQANKFDGLDDVDDMAHKI